MGIISLLSVLTVICSASAYPAVAKTAAISTSALLPLPSDSHHPNTDKLNIAHGNPLSRNFKTAVDSAPSSLQISTTVIVKDSSSLLKDEEKPSTGVEVNHALSPGSAGPRPMLKDAWLLRCRKKHKTDRVKRQKCIDEASKWYEDHGWKNIPSPIDIDSDSTDDEGKQVDHAPIPHLISSIKLEFGARKEECNWAHELDKVQRAICLKEAKQWYEAYSLGNTRSSIIVRQPKDGGTPGMVDRSEQRHQAWIRICNQQYATEKVQRIACIKEADQRSKARHGRRAEPILTSPPIETTIANVVPTFDGNEHVTAAYCWRHQEEHQCAEWAKKWRAWANSKNPIDVPFKFLSDEHFTTLEQEITRIDDDFADRESLLAKGVSSSPEGIFAVSQWIQQICQQHPNESACIKDQEMKAKNAIETRKDSQTVKRDGNTTPSKAKGVVDEDLPRMWGLVDSVLEALTNGIKTERKEKYHKTWKVIMDLTDALQIDRQGHHQTKDLRPRQGHLKSDATGYLPALIKRNKHTAPLPPQSLISKFEPRKVHNVPVGSLLPDINCEAMVSDPECEEYFKTTMHWFDTEPTAEYCMRHPEDLACVEWEKKLHKGIALKRENPMLEPKDGQPDGTKPNEP
jgi:hypothetical protein